MIRPRKRSGSTARSPLRNDRASLPLTRGAAFSFERRVAADGGLRSAASQVVTPDFAASATSRSGGGGEPVSVEEIERRIECLGFFEQGFLVVAERRRRELGEQCVRLHLVVYHRMPDVASPDH